MSGSSIPGKLQAEAPLTLACHDLPGIGYHGKARDNGIGIDSVQPPHPNVPEPKSFGAPNGDRFSCMGSLKTEQVEILGSLKNTSTHDEKDSSDFDDNNNSIKFETDEDDVVKIHESPDRCLWELFANQLEGDFMMACSPPRIMSSPLRPNYKDNQADIIWLGLAGINNEKETTKWKQQLTMALGPDNDLGVGEIGARGRLVDVFIHSWAAVSRSRGRSAPCPQIRVIYSLFILLQFDLAGEQSQFATENKTASERTFVRFFSTKHESLRITVGRWLPKETPIRSAPRPGGIYLIPITRRGSL
ncbi:hypothetical protein ACH5RR_010924 [Cinchona calisaya]|uniref:Uncharacterized protein n=1 Tax=Cinchona calisaya TaxID=153742 RepID=A0ABD3A4Y2_9GENT